MINLDLDPIVFENRESLRETSKDDSDPYDIHYNPFCLHWQIKKAAAACVNGSRIHQKKFSIFSRKNFYYRKICAILWSGRLFCGFSLCGKKMQNQAELTCKESFYKNL